MIKAINGTLNLIFLLAGFAFGIIAGSYVQVTKSEGKLLQAWEAVNKNAQAEIRKAYTQGLKDGGPHKLPYQ